MQYPLVTIICISFNHSKYVADALNAVWNLEYPNVELIIADDASTDKSQQVIKELILGKKVELLFNTINIGHCKTFNNALKLAKGEFIIDLSADDILLPNSVSNGLARFNEMGKSFGVFFSNALHIDEDGIEIGAHITPSFFYLGVVPQGDVYRNLLSKYFISPPTMIFRKELMEELGGYNEALSYEDFDFWVRSSRITKYCYLSEATVKKRIHTESVSSKQYIKNSKMLGSTLQVCNTAFSLNKTKSEDFSLIMRLAYEAKMALFSNNYSIALKMFILAIKVFFKIRS